MCVPGGMGGGGLGGGVGWVGWVEGWGVLRGLLRFLKVGESVFRYSQIRDI